MIGHLDRLERLRSKLEIGSTFDAVVISDIIDVRWLTGFGGSVGTVVVDRSSAFLLVDSRYGDQARNQVSNCEVLVTRPGATKDDSVSRAVAGLQRVAFDDRRTTVSEWRRLSGAVGFELIAAGDRFGDLRAVKDAIEISHIEKAARAADSALAEVIPHLSTGVVTECDLRDELEAKMRAHGADGPGYSTIIASGPNSALPHHQPTTRRIAEGDSVVIDVGGVVEGYRSDMTRTYFVGEVDPLLRTFHDLLRDVQSAVVGMVRPGVTADSLDTTTRESLAQFSDYVLHSTGHGVGLEIHESPWLRSGSRDVLEAGHVLTIEPGLYRVGVGGVRIEDLLLVEPTGSRILTTTPKDPLCLQSAPTI